MQETELIIYNPFPIRGELKCKKNESMDKTVTVTEREIMMYVGKDIIWITKYKDGVLNIGMNMSSHCSVSGRWDLQLSEEQKSQLKIFITTL